MHQNILNNISSPFFIRDVIGRTMASKKSLSPYSQDCEYDIIPMTILA